jgi:hypothetical protein
MKKLTLLLTFVFVLGFAGMAMAADNDNHTVSFQIPTVNEIVIAGDVAIGTLAAPNPGDATFADQSGSTTYSFSTNHNSADSDIECSLDSDNTIGNLLMTIAPPGTGTGSTDLNINGFATTPTDVVTGITPTTGSGFNLQYTISGVPTSTPAQTVTKTVTLTIVNN